MLWKREEGGRERGVFWLKECGGQQPENNKEGVNESRREDERSVEIEGETKRENTRDDEERKEETSRGKASCNSAGQFGAVC
jgi:hypothetical protein